MNLIETYNTILLRTDQTRPHTPLSNHQVSFKSTQLTKCFFVKNSFTRALQNLSWTERGFLFFDWTKRHQQCTITARQQRPLVVESFKPPACYYEPHHTTTDKDLEKGKPWKCHRVISQTDYHHHLTCSKVISPGRSSLGRLTWRVDSRLCGTPCRGVMTGTTELGLGWPVEGVVVSACLFTPLLACQGERRHTG